MSENELRAAAERAASLALVKSWLKEHPDDDAEPLTEEWLRSVGFKDRGEFCIAITETSDGCVFVLKCTDYLNLPCCWELWNELQNMDTEDWEKACLPCQPQTRGEVRRLVAALGMKLETQGEV